MTKKILLTSFDTWLSEQQSNSSDDLLLELATMTDVCDDLFFLRRLLVDIEVASSVVISKINQLQPDGVICCGMAASRKNLSVEVIARLESIQSTDIVTKHWGDNFCPASLQTNVNVEQLIMGTEAVEISYDCGKFVCEGLYYSVLHHLRKSQLSIPCIFVHVPILDQGNLLGIIADFVLIINNFLNLTDKSR